MARIVIIVLFCLLINATTFVHHHVTNASCHSNGPNSPPYNPKGTPATLTLNGFGPGEEGGNPSECDGRYHPLPQRVVALSTGWYSKGSRCGQTVKIMTTNGRTSMAKVVDECDSLNGCDKEHDFQPPCRTNIVDASKTVWDDLGLNTDDGEVPVTWSIV